MESQTRLWRDPTPLTEPLLEDLLNPALSPITICQIHNITLDQLDALTQSDQYHRTINHIKNVHAARREAIHEELQTQSLAALRDIVQDTTEQSSTGGTGVSPVRAHAPSQLRAAHISATTRHHPPTRHQRPPPRDPPKSHQHHPRQHQTRSGTIYTQ